VFKELLPDFSRIAPPQILTVAEWAAKDSSSYHGIFENSRFRLHIDTAKNGALRANVFRKSGEAGLLEDGPCIKRYFKAAVDDVFLPTEPEPQVCPALRYSHIESGVGFRYVSTGTYVFARVA
jgi:hypothetical protein